ncbi:hypothetical protein [Comamonas sp. CMM02]|uniref:hypothetical protein n=1 Tax=Comamonas sp. CMM02 TaxID=2769307 RepID=UPI001783B296|nr:hypothetical protein [Comamonas sp. CMM02]MBD9400822.1 hypothetical protein [Comamonas sp. CMM02]
MTKPEAAPKRRRTFDEILYIRIDPQDASQVRQIAADEESKYTATVRKLIGLGLKAYAEQVEKAPAAAS